MRFKNFIIILVLFISIAKAQERNCSNTWTETVTLILENKDCIEEVYLGGYNLEPPPIAEIKLDSKILNVSYDHDFETLKYDYVWKMRDVGEFIIPLEHLKEVRIQEEYLYLTLFDDYAKHSNQQYLWSPSGEGYLYEPNSGTVNTDFIAFSVSNTAVNSQLLKAFKELVCLAEKKQKDD